MRRGLTALLAPVAPPQRRSAASLVSTTETGIVPTVRRAGALGLAREWEAGYAALFCANLAARIGVLTVLPTLPRRRALGPVNIR